MGNGEIDMLTYNEKVRLQDLADDLWHYVFSTMENEVDFSSRLCADIAQRTVEAFRSAYEHAE